MPLFSPQPQPLANWLSNDAGLSKEQGAGMNAQAPNPMSFFSMLAPPTSGLDLANWFNRQNPQG